MFSGTGRELEIFNVFEEGKNAPYGTRRPGRSFSASISRVTWAGA